MSDPSEIRFVTATQVRSAIAGLGFHPDDVFKVEMSLHEVTVHYQSRHNGVLTGGRLVTTVPIDRKAGA